YKAGPGYDLASGIGTPDAWNFARDAASIVGDHAGNVATPSPTPSPTLPPGRTTLHHPGRGQAASLLWTADASSTGVRNDSAE
ncbi:MAG: hypothetical protein ACRDHW_21455, partial [Ktedonobacteraceae bacterium]